MNSINTLYQDNLRILLLKFIEKNHICNKLMAKVGKHYSVTQSLLNHYKLEQKLDNPFIEYSRYVLTKGNENEMTNFAKGIKKQLNVNKGRLELIAPKKLS